MDYSAVSQSVAEARAQIAATDEPQWTPHARAEWLAALDAIERFLDGDDSEQGFSIVRSLDGSRGTDGPTSQAILRVASALGRNGIDRYR